MTEAAKTLLVTGGSRGIGAACAIHGAKAGYRVAVNYVSDEAAANRVVAEIEAAGGEAFAICADVAVEVEILAMFQAVDERWNRLDAFVNNAGVVDVASRVEGMSAARLQRMFAINLTGSFLCAREAVLRMSTVRGGLGGAIVNVSSAAARIASPNQYVDYAAAKAGIDILTKGLALEVAAEGVRVNAVRPGIIDTDIHASGGEPDRVRRLREMVPMKREGSPLEVARAILWLLSDEASYVTGTVMDVSGGR